MVLMESSPFFRLGDDSALRVSTRVLLYQGSYSPAARPSLLPWTLVDLGCEALLRYALEHAIEVHAPRPAGVRRRLPSLLDRAIAPWCPGHSMHPPDIRLACLTRHP